MAQDSYRLCEKISPVTPVIAWQSNSNSLSKVSWRPRRSGSPDILLDFDGYVREVTSIGATPLRTDIPHEHGSRPILGNIRTFIK